MQNDRNDVISRQAAIDAVLDRMNVEKHGRNAKPEEIQWALEKLPSAQPERWIPCSERLPEGVCHCIVTVKVKHINDYSDYEADTAVFADGIFTTANSWWRVENVIAWMPLPEPYKGDR